MTNNNGWPSRRRFLQLMAASALIPPVFATSASAMTGNNPVWSENQLTGTTSWVLSNANLDSAPTVRGYPSKMSVATGEQILFMIDCPTPQLLDLQIYRMGWYSGAGGRLMTTVSGVSGVAASQPTVDPGLGTVRAQWQATHSLTIPSNWVTGVYLVKLITAAGNDAYIKFVVRDDARDSDFLIQVADFTDHAYSNWPDDGVLGKSLYGYNSSGPNTITGAAQAAQVSFDRPFPNAGAGQFFEWDYYFVRWMEKEGFDISYSSNIDTYQSPSRLLDFDAFLSTGHDEYWTGEMYNAVEAARDGGVHLGFFGANDVYWQVRVSDDGATPDRLMTCYKSAALDPEPDSAKKTDRFRVIGRPEQDLIGIQYVAAGPSSSPVDHTDLVFQNVSYWPYSGTGAVEGAIGPKIVGFEVDDYFASVGPQKLNQSFLAKSPFTSSSNQAVNQRTSLYQSDANSWVFSAGTMAWSWALDRAGLVDERVRGLTRNILNEFLSPANLGTSAGDSVVPSLDVVFPVDDGSLPSAAFSFSGTAVDDASGVSAVELVVRNTATVMHLRPDGSLGGWTRLSAVLDSPGGLSTSWSYAAPALPPGPYYVAARVIDGGGNVSAWLYHTFDVVGADSVVPSLDVVFPVDDGSLPSAAFSFSGTAVDDASGVSAVELVVRNTATVMHLRPDGSLGGWTRLSAVLDSPGGLSTSWSYAAPALPPGPYYVAARVIDGGGNVSAWLYHTFDVVGADSVVPSLDVVFPVDDGSLPSAAFSFSGTAVDDASGVSAVELVVRNTATVMHLRPDGSLGGWTRLSAVLDSPGGLSTSWSYAAPALPPGPYYVAARVIDGGGNVSAWLYHTFDVVGADSVVPSLDVVFPVDDGSLPSAAFSFSGTAVDDASGVSAVELVVRNTATVMHLRPDGSLGGWTRLSAVLDSPGGLSTSWSYAAPALPPGPYYVAARVIDGGGNVSAWLYHTFDVVGADSVVPSLDVVFPVDDGSLPSAAFSFSGTAVDDASGVSAVELVVRNTATVMHLRPDGSLGGWTRLSAVLDSPGGLSTSWSYAAPALPPGPYYVAARVIDGGGNVSAWLYHTFDVT